MAKEPETYKGRPVFLASNSAQLAKAVANYEAEVEPPYVVRIRKGTKKVAERAFHDNSKIGVVLLPDTVTRIGCEAFYYCDNLTEIHMPDSLKWIQSDAFQMCKKLTDIHIPDSVSDIDDAAFWGCESLRSISIPDSVGFIGEDALGLCDNLEEVRINNPRLLEDSDLPRKAKVLSLYGVTLAHFIEELRRFAAKYPERKVACKLDNGEYYYINDMDEFEDGLDAVVLCRYAGTVSDFFTVSDFLETDPAFFDSSEVIVKHFFDNVIDNEYTYHCQIFHTIAELKTGIFFKAKDGEEDVIAFRPGFVYGFDEDE